jgi:hypothetical protein
MNSTTQYAARALSETPATLNGTHTLAHTLRINTPLLSGHPSSSWWGPVGAAAAAAKHSQQLPHSKQHTKINAVTYRLQSMH